MKTTVNLLLFLFFISLQSAGMGKWIAGDFHVHSTGASDDTDAVSYPEEIKKVALQHGLSFIMLSDHSNAMGLENGGPDFVYWEKAKKLTDPGRFIMVDSVEISPLCMRGAGHVSYVPLALERVDPRWGFRDRPPCKVKGRMAIQEVKKRKGFAIVTHPYSAIAPWIEYDWTSFEYDALEIYNAGLLYDKGDYKSTYAYFCDLANGKKTVPIGSSDCHRVHTPYPGTLSNSALGFARTWVDVPEMSWAAIVDALKKGKVVVGDKTNFVELKVGRQSLGDTIKVVKGETVEVTVDGRTEVSNWLRLLFIPKGSCRDTRSENRKFHIKPQVLLKQEVQKGEFSVKPSVLLRESGALIGFLGKPNRSRSVQNISITGPIWVELQP